MSSKIGPGTRLNGIYEIERLLGVGGMGEVYRGRAIETGDPVAIKTIRSDLVGNDSAMALFRKEAAALHNLHHEAIVRYFVFSIDPATGSPYLAMEYVDGPALSDVLKRGPLGFDSVRLLARRIGSGLQVAHDAGLVHRDLSPDNIILPGEGVARAKLIDFGIARDMVRTERTVIGDSFAGKLTYASPEQFGHFGGVVTAKSDIYSLGLVLAEAISGRALFAGGSQVDVVEARRQRADLSRVDARLQPLLQSMLAPDPNERLASMQDVVAWASGDHRNAPPPRQNRKTFMLAGVGAIAVLIGAGVLVSRGWYPSPIPGPSSGPGSTPSLVEALKAPRQEPSYPPFNPPARPTEKPIVPADPLRRVATFVKEYDAGDCVALVVSSNTGASAVIEAFGSTTGPIEVFDQAFMREMNFEAQINFRHVAEAQCPAVRFLRRADAKIGLEPGLVLEAFDFKSGQPFSAKSDIVDGRHLDLLLVSADGYAYNLSQYAKQEGNQVSFRTRLSLPPNSREPMPQLVMLFATPTPLALLATKAALPADSLFPMLIGEARDLNGAMEVQAKFFYLRP